MAMHEERDPETGRIYRTFVIETIAEKAKDLIHHAHCNACQHSKRIDMAFWIEKLGPDYMMDRFIKRLRCANCRSKDVRLIGSHHGRPTP